MPRASRIRLTFALLLAVALSGCLAHSRDFYGEAPAERAQPDELARLYFVRADEPFMVAAELTVVVNGRRVGTLRNGEVFYRDARPGRYEVHVAGAEDDVVELRVGPGERAYVQADIEWRMLGFRFVAEPLAPEDGAALAAALPLVTGLEADLQRADPDPPELDPRPELGS